MIKYIFLLLIMYFIKSVFHSVFWHTNSVILLNIIDSTSLYPHIVPTVLTLFFLSFPFCFISPFCSITAFSFLVYLLSFSFSIKTCIFDHYWVQIYRKFLNFFCSIFLLYWKIVMLQVFQLFLGELQIVLQFSSSRVLYLLSHLSVKIYIVHPNVICDPFHLYEINYWSCTSSPHDLLLDLLCQCHVFVRWLIVFCMTL